VKQRGPTTELEELAWAAYESGDMQAALPRFLDLAASGKPYYLVVAARMYMDGEGTPSDTARAAELLEQASSLGVREALLQRAALADQMGNDREYFLLVTQAERDGLLPAQYLSAFCYLDGRGTVPDVSKGMALMDLASSRGHLGAKAFVARQLVKHPTNPFDVVRGLGLLVYTAIRMLALVLTNPHDPRLR
jgi:TPR repeat protein